MAGALLEVNNLKTHLFLKRGVVKAVDGVSFRVFPGQSLGIVGESGSGKSMTVSSVMRLLPPAGQIVEGRILFNGQDLLEKSEREMCDIRGKEIAMIMQDPMNSLNPGYTVGNQLGEAIRLHTDIRSRRQVKARSVAALEEVCIPAPETRLRAFPHELSGGMRQRVVGAIGISCEPKFLIADEPTTALDVTIQAQYLKLLRDIQGRTGIGMIFITHDLGIVAKMCDHVCVMYLGKIVEQGPVSDIWRHPRHKYTQALLKSIPSVDHKAERLYAIEGTVPSAIHPPEGCRFCTRCEFADERCFHAEPPATDLGGGHICNCWKIEG